MSSKPDVLLLGATGFTGRLIAKYLSTHRDGSSFNLTLAARSKARLDAVASDLGLGGAVRLHVVDVTRPEEIEAAVAGATVVINTVGPFWTWGTPVVQACVKHGVHYVDLTGETVWIKRIITQFHYAATKTGSIIVPSCGFDSVPADIISYISSKTLRETSGEPVDIDTSVSAYLVKGGMSGGTISTMITGIEEVSADAQRVASAAYSLSPGSPSPPAAANITLIFLPVVGVRPPSPRLIYRLFLPDRRETLTGAFFFLSPANNAIVQRSWGLFETAAAHDPTHPRYGPRFTYDEFLVTGGAIRSLILTLGMAIALGGMLISPLRWLLKKVLPKAGEGPSESVLQNGFMKVTNVTTAVAARSRMPVQVETVMTGQGDPGYSLTAVFISEAALSIALAEPGALPALGRGGGVLTPATALGDVFVERLAASGRVTFESKVVTAPRAPEGKKTV
ncbi:Saccharopine dehydrogenase-domain-containing protein [Mycena maculata]|uniref:Saccharopine dehydrogenase-domain-containing protein n=1 Tax=Mycena maculata TaxID=230809 RepID=A0AAD7N9A6_9AGAR|nr:Saccharopine dehydrogenase-domain-containing protein [Mycena maculata]